MRRRRSVRAGGPARRRLRARAMILSAAPGLHGDDVARLVLAEPEGVRRRSRRGRSSSAPMPDAIAISASATSRPPSETSCTAVTTPSRDQRAHEIAVAPLGGEIDRRRRALLAPADVAQIERLAEPALGLADQQDRLVRGLEGERRRLGEVVDHADAADGRASAGWRGRWSRCRARRCRTRPGSRAPCRPRAMPRMQPTNWPMISGRSGLPKLRLSVSASGLRADRGEVAPGFGHRLLAALERIGLAVARRHVGGERERLRAVARRAPPRRRRPAAAPCCRG